MLIHEQMITSNNGRLDGIRLLTKIGKLYYEHHLTQQEIADDLCISRAKVSRLLHEARDENIVNITVTSPPGVHADLERHLETRFGLREAVVVEEDHWSSQDAVTRAIGIAAAQYLRRTLQDEDVIDISWGRTLSSMVDALTPRAAPESHIVQLIGGLGPPEAEVHATDLARRMASAIGCKLTLLPAPGIVDSQKAKQIMLSDQHVKRAFEMMPQLDVAYVGIGAPTPDSVVMQNGVVSCGQREALAALGAVGDIALRFFDAGGQPIVSEFNERVLGIALEQLKRVKRVVGLSGGPEKRHVVRAALKGGLISVLITDYRTACSVLNSN
ncbi:MAG: sugar-binding transcriptional regulator [Chloroflexi bacterium]|nr:sugar-binding transcriptional regulator [Chloroflexota bacterium]